MHLLNAAVAATSIIVGTAGASVAYGAMNTPPVQPQDVPKQETVYTFAPCDPPAVLTDGACVTTMVKTVVKQAKPKVITVVETHRSSKGSSGGSTRTAKQDRHHADDDHDEDEHHEEDHGEDADD